MTTKAGVWIDHAQAILVLLKDAGPVIKTFTANVKKPEGSAADHSYTPRDYVAEDKLEHKADSILKNFYDEVIGCLQGSEALLILGPAEAKGEFQKRFESKKTGSLVVEVETAERMTDRQLVAKVTEHFSANNQ